MIWRPRQRQFVAGTRCLDHGCRPERSDIARLRYVKFAATDDDEADAVRDQPVSCWLRSLLQTPVLLHAAAPTSAAPGTDNATACAL